jgi:hypothetical protein
MEGRGTAEDAWDVLNELAGTIDGDDAWYAAWYAATFRRAFDGAPRPTASWNSGKSWNAWDAATKSWHDATAWTATDWAAYWRNPAATGGDGADGWWDTPADGRAIDRGNDGTTPEPGDVRGDDGAGTTADRVTE